jgi:hypothetical protein
MASETLDCPAQPAKTVLRMRTPSKIALETEEPTIACVFNIRPASSKIANLCSLQGNHCAIFNYDFGIPKPTRRF